MGKSLLDLQTYTHVLLRCCYAIFFIWGLRVLGNYFKQTLLCVCALYDTYNKIDRSYNSRSFGRLSDILHPDKPPVLSILRIHKALSKQVYIRVERVEYCKLFRRDAVCSIKYAETARIANLLFFQRHSAASYDQSRRQWNILARCICVSFFRIRIPTSWQTRSPTRLNATRRSYPRWDTGRPSIWCRCVTARAAPGRSRRTADPSLQSLPRRLHANIFHFVL